MKIKIVKNYKEISKITANIIKEQIIQKDNSVLGLATGSTPIGTYSNLVQYYKNGEISFKNVTTFNLDEYVGLGGEHIKSYRYFMNDNLFSKIDINIDNTFIPLGIGDPYLNSTNFEKLISKKGPIDIQILGIGNNAHIGFNEPGSDEYGKTMEVQLTKSTIDSNKRFFTSFNDVPKSAISMGISTIMKSKLIVLIASGKSKARAIRDMIEGEITSDVPASFLQKHPNVVVIIDKEAASNLNIYKS